MGQVSLNESPIWVDAHKARHEDRWESRLSQYAIAEDIKTQGNKKAGKEAVLWRSK
jgi:hypothetical protein